MATGRIGHRACVVLRDIPDTEHLCLGELLFT